MTANQPKRKIIRNALVGLFFFLAAASTAQALDLPVVNGQTVAWNAESVQSQLDLSNTELNSVAAARNQAYRNGQAALSQTYDARYNEIRQDITELESMQRSFDLISRGQNGQLTAADLPALNAADQDMVARNRATIQGRQGAVRSEMYGSILADLRAQRAALQNNTAVRDRLIREAEAHRNAINSGNATARDQATNAAQDAANQSASAMGIDCEFNLTGKSFDPRACLVIYGAAISDLGLHFTIWVLHLVEGLFNTTITFTIVEFSEFINQPFVKEVWSQMRNLANVLMLFILLYAAIGLVLELRNVESKRIVTNVIFAALLINFSFFLTGEAIRVSNIVTVALYKKAALVTTGSGAGAKEEYDLSKKLTQTFTPKTGTAKSEIDRNLTTANIWDRLLGIILEKAGQFVVLLITAIVLIAAMLALIKRFVVLVFVMIFSPVPFISGSVPKLKELGDSWASALTKQLIFAPAYFLALWLAVQVITSIGTITGNISGLSAAVTPISAKALMYALIINAFMIGALLVGNALGDKGSAGAVGMLKGWGNRAKGFAAGGAAGWLGRKTLGQFGSAATENERLRNAAAQRGVTGWIARRALFASDKMANSTFDVRNTEAGKALGVNKWGKPAPKGGYSKELKDSVEKEKKFAATLIGEDKGAVKEAEKNKEEKSKAHDESKAGVKTAKTNVVAVNAEITEHQNKINREKELLTRAEELATNPYTAPEIQERAKKVVEDKSARIKKMEEEEAKALQDKLVAAKAEAEKAKAAEKKAQEEATEAEEAIGAARRRRQEEYAKTVEARPFWGRKRKKQAEAIRDQAKKSKKEKDREKILSLLDEKEKGGDKEGDKAKEEKPEAGAEKK